jgi:hypothetical protein
MDAEDSPWGGALQFSYSLHLELTINLDVPSRSSSNANLDKADETEALGTIEYLPTVSVTH